MGAGRLFVPSAMTWWHRYRRWNWDCYCLASNFVSLVFVFTVNDMRVTCRGWHCQFSRHVWLTVAWRGVGDQLKCSTLERRAGGSMAYVKIRSTVIWATRRLGDIYLGRLGEKCWTFGRKLPEYNIIRHSCNLIEIIFVMSISKLSPNRKQVRRA